MLRCLMLLMLFAFTAMSGAGQEPDLTELPIWIQAQMASKSVPLR